MLVSHSTTETPPELVRVFPCVFGFLDTKQKPSYSLTFAKHFMVKYAFIFHTLYIGKDWIYIAALEF